MSNGESPTAAPAATSPAGTHPMQHGHRPAASEKVPATLVPENGWHFLHLFYRIDRAIWSGLDPETRQQGIEQVVSLLDPKAGHAPTQIHSFAIPGHKADFGVVLADPDLTKVHHIEVGLQTSKLGPALVPTYSFYSITEISEYVPDAEQYGKILEREGTDPASDVFKTKVASYAKRLEPMNKQRLYPEFPDWPCLCFYPMSKMRTEGQNWYLLPFEARSELMAQHGRSGMKFAGKVSQVITASTGLDDWEWGVTLWARNPSYLKDIVYTMRFDESSAKYALFGDFYFGYILPPDRLVQSIGLT